MDDARTVAGDLEEHLGVVGAGAVVRCARDREPVRQGGRDSGEHGSERQERETAEAGSDTAGSDGSTALGSM